MVRGTSNMSTPQVEIAPACNRCNACFAGYIRPLPSPMNTKVASYTTPKGDVHSLGMRVLGCLSLLVKSGNLDRPIPPPCSLGEGADQIKFVFATPRYQPTTRPPHCWVAIEAEFGRNRHPAAEAGHGGQTLHLGRAKPVADVECRPRRDLLAIFPGVPMLLPPPGAPLKGQGEKNAVTHPGGEQ